MEAVAADSRGDTVGAASAAVLYPALRMGKYGLASAIYLGVIAAAFVGVLPMMVGIFAGREGLGPQAAGYIVAFELGAQLCGTATFFALRASSWKPLTAMAIALMVVGNVGSAFAPSLTLLVATRIVVGLGEGVARALCFAVLGLALNPGRQLAIYAVGQMLVSAAGFFAIPMLATIFGWPGPLLILAGLCASAAWTLKYIPSLGKGNPVRKVASRRLDTRLYFGMLGVFIYFAGQGALWAYLERIGVSRLIATTTIASALSASMVAGLAASLLVIIYAHRIHALAGILCGCVVSLGAIWLLITGRTDLAYGIGICSFNFAWVFTFPFQFEAIARADSSGLAAAAIPAVDGLAIAAGPAVAASVLPQFGLEFIPYLSLIGVVVGLAFLLPLGLVRAGRWNEGNTV